MNFTNRTSVKVFMFGLSIALSAQMALAGIVSGIEDKISRAMMYQPYTEVLLDAFRGSYDDQGRIGTSQLPEVYFAETFAPTSTYELDAFTIHVVRERETRSGAYVQLNVFVQNASAEKQDKLEALIKRALEKSGWNAQTVKFRNGVRLGVGVGPESMELNAFHNVKIARFIENMLLLTK